ncbi:Gfo/Idh/MocA family oxidoreductase [Saccharibacillus sp. CPCC 101409]|uniref:Gfo/Idh/MocA family protein n=1 Tax=Saccharibacillus sp. CPCC 101409 TaxID=3058041 RepID=UPI0026710389|nr:Gfo/Idh/MocA family oxidoreductase [Saccharibacillus sp. CPCC 101409]MDO3408361.1 Gfo/Idh/MocA family oxidoreductase [Saccharibacillus sp. CPCC 101409]
MGEGNKDKIKWGIIGTGWIADQFAADLKHASNGELYAVGSRTLESAREFAGKFDIPQAYGSYEELVGDPEVDAVYVGTPHPFHKENVLTALNAGKAVLCEKPFTVNAKELDEMIETAREKKLFLMEAMWSRFLSPLVQVRKWLSEQKIGEIRIVKAEFGFDAGWNPEGRLLNPELGGGALLDAGVYPVSFASMVFGPNPQSVWTTAHIGETGVDEHFSILLDYGSGRTASLNGGVRLNMPNDAYIHGTNGYIHIPQFLFAKEATLYVSGEEPVTVTDDREDRGIKGYAYEAEEVGRALLEGRRESGIISLAESLGIMRLLDNVRGQWGLKYPFE